MFRRSQLVTRPNPASDLLRRLFAEKVPDEQNPESGGGSGESRYFRKKISDNLRRVKESVRRRRRKRDRPDLEDENVSEK
ncbi:hypothetical protein MTP99_009033 [Tenebrio molitor]|jgi:hypothetical protein|nr:hypothetical protein MTP99_009033 [Tenebrio molitor]